MLVGNYLFLASGYQEEKGKRGKGERVKNLGSGIPLYPFSFFVPWGQVIHILIKKPINWLLPTGNW
jgi:hypothetical protein